MIKAISNLTNHTTMHTTHVQAPTPAGRTPIFSRTHSLLRRFAATAIFLLGIAIPAIAQQYVFLYKNGNTVYFLRNNSGTIERQANFGTYASNCIWNATSSTSTTFINEGYGLYRSSNTLYAVSTNGYYTPTTWTITTYGRVNYSNRYIRYNSGWTSLNNTNSPGTGVEYTVLFEYSSHDAILSTPTITGTAILSNTGSANYSVSASATQQYHQFDGYSGTTATTYYWYSDALKNTKPNDTEINTGTWSLSGNTINSTTYATVNTTSGQITVSSLPPTDLSMTLTCSVTSNGITKTASKTIILYATTVEDPTITRSGDNISLATTSFGTTIYYTTDGSTPSTSNGSAYTTPFSIEQLTYPVTIKAIAIRNGNSSSVTTQTYNAPKCATPVISISSTGAVTITCDTEGATIRYTQGGDPDNPTANTGTVGTSTTLTNLQYIKVIATRDGYDDSEVVTDQYVTTGTSDGKVVLDDREEHTWTYYVDGNSPIHSLRPADIKITYKGYGDKTMTSTNTDRQPANSAFDQDVANTAVQVNKNESGHTFIYYKTLENSIEDGTGNYSYTMIPNPFQVRPTYGTGNGRWRGFYAWRVNYMSSGLSIKVGNTTYNKTQAEGSLIIYAEQEVEFITTNAKANEVTFEALWAKAYLDDANNYYSNNGDYRNAYERNFKKVTSLSTYSYPVTISSISPDGSGNVANVSGPNRTNYTCNNDVKLENMNLNMSNYYIDGNSYNLTIGRGVKNGNNNVASSVYGDYSGSSVRSKFTLRIESGRYSDARIFYNSSRASCGDTFTSYAYIGSDYDRANNENNDNLVISSRVGLSSEMAFTNAASSIDVTVLSGTFGSNTADVEFYMGYQNATTGTSQAKRSVRIYGGNFLGGLAGGIEGGALNANTIYLTMRISGGTIHRYLYGSGQFSPAYGTRLIVITGGTFDSWVSGGCYGTNNEEGNTEGNTYLYFGGRATQTNTEGIFGAGYGNYTTGNDKYTVHKSTVVFADLATTAGSVYGGGNNGYAKQDINVYITGGTISGDVYGGANKAPSKGNIAVTVTGGTVNGGVYGGSNQSGDISGNITVDIYGTDPQPNNSYAINQVFGGGNQANYSKAPTVTVHCGDDISVGELYGGGNQATVAGTNVTVSGGNRIGYVYGGGRQAAVNGNTSVKVYGGTIEHVFAGNNISGTISGTLSVEVDRGDDDCLLKIGELYGGGNQAASKAGSITIGCTGVLTDGHNNLSSTNRIGYELEGIGDVYGGANNADITSGDITLNIQSGMIARVFGGNNVDGSISGNISVSINKNSSTCGWYVGDVFGAGNLAQYTIPNNGSLAVSILNGTVSGNVYGGGKGQLVDGNQRGIKGKVTGSPSITIGDNVSGHTVSILGEVYGGGDAADVTGTPVIVVNDHSTAQSGAHVCSTHIGYLYGGGNAADVGGTNITINGGTITNSAFGGGHGDKDAENPSKYADVKDNVVFNINGGHISKVFAGSNSKGNISGSSTLTIEKSGNCPMIIDEVYGGGNLAAGNAGTININCTGDLVAGNSGQEANPSYIGVSLEGIGTVYGGANAADIGSSQANSNITLNINSGMIANVFGGNNQSGSIYGTIEVNINKGAGSCGWYVGNVFGGGNLAIYSGTPAVNIKNGTVSGNVYGGGNGDPDDETQVPGQVAGSVVTIGDNTNSSGYAVVVGNVYGGGNAAKVAGNTSITYNDTNTSSKVAKLFGGGKAAGVTGTGTVTLTAGSVSAGVYGGCDSVGTVSGDISVYLNGGTVGATNSRADVFGGGLGSATATGGHIGVTLGSATVYGDIYGGSALGQVNGSTSHTTNLSINGTSLNGTVYGGGKGQVQGDSIKAISNGNIIVNYNGVNAGLIGGIYGGANVNGNVKGNIQVNILANVGATSNNNSRNIFGGGYGDATTTEGNIEVNIGTLDGNKTPVIYGDIYGGSALGNVNKDASNTTTVNFRNGTLHGNLYGGGLGQKTPTPIAAKVNGKVYVNIGASNQSNCAINLTGVSIYGCNNTNGSPQDDVEVNVYNTAHTTENAVGYTGNNPTYAIYQVFGGGNEADYSPAAGKKTTVNILGCNNTIQRVFGGGNAAAALGVVTTIDGGRFDYVFGGGNGQSQPANIGTGGTNLTVHGGKINYLFGGSNTSGTISGSMGISVDATGSCASDMYIAEFFCGNNLANIGTAENPVNINATIGCDTKFGDVYGGCNLADIVGNVTLTVEGGEMNRVFGGSKGRSATSDPSNSTPKAANINGDVTLNITGGKIGSAFGGSNINGNITGSIEVNVEKAANPCVWQIGDVFGASNDAAYTPSKEGNTLKVNIKNGTIGGSVFGGGKGPTATATSNPQVTIGDATEGYTAVITGDVYGGGDAAAVDGVPVVRVINKCNTSIGNVYGGGNAADVSATSVTIDGGTITGDVYGGGHGDKAILNVGNETGHSDKVANVNGNVSVTVTGGTIHRVFGGSNTNGNITGTVAVNVNKGANSCDLNIDELYGGGNMAAGNAGSITIGCTGGANEGIGDVYGGANQADIGSSSQASNISLSITGGKIGRVFGGNNTSGTIYGTIQVNIDWATGNDACGVNSLGSVFGGGNQASYSAPTGSTNYPVVNIKNGTITNNVFGGGLGATAVVKGNPQVTIGDATRLNNDAIVAVVSGDVYGGGDAAAVDGVPVVRVINKCNTSIGNVYGGGNAADVSATSVTIDGGTITGDVFGGGHGDKLSLATQEDPDHSDKEANVGGDVTVLITGGTIDRVFGGSNANGNIGGEVNVTVRKETTSCDMHIAELYGGGNMANGNAGTITIVRTGGDTEGIGDVYGGANKADIGTSENHSDIELTITGGSIDNVFGGNNNSGTIYGNIQVNVNISNNVGTNYIGNVYGGGNVAPYSNSGSYPEVNIINGTVSGNVFGGGLGANARVTANPKVVLTGGIINGKVFGGGEAAPVYGNPTVIANNATASHLYGGGLGTTATVIGFTTVTVNDGTYGYVFGGGEEAGLSRSATVNIAGGTITYDVYGGGALAHTNTSNYNTSSGAISINTDTTKVNLTGGTVHNVYGGGLGDLAEEGVGHQDLAAIVYGNVLVNLNKGVASGSKGSIVTGNIFGCNNINGTPKGSVTVHVYGTQNSHVNTIGDKSYTPFEFDVPAVYGGGNMAAYIPASNIPTHVIIEGCGLTSIGYVYGGGNAAPVPATDVLIMGSDTIYSVFGGGNGKDKITVGNQQKDNPGADVGIRQVSIDEYSLATNYQYNDPKYTTDKYYIMYGDTVGTSIIGTTTVTILGGTVEQLFGGSNTKGDIIKEAKVLLGDEDLKTCEFNVGGVYGGSNEAYMSGSADIEMRCMDGMAQIYGGSKMADVSKDIVLTITGGHYDKVFGGNNLSGRIYGSITINIEQTGCLPIKIGELYGGGNQAPYSIYGYKSTSKQVVIDGQTVTHYDLNTTAVAGVDTYDDPIINIVSCDSIGKVFGGGLKAEMVGSPHIYVDMVKGWTNGSYSGQKPGVEDPNKDYANTKYKYTAIGTIDTIFGGGNMADVNGDSYIFIGTRDSITVHDVKKGVYDVISVGRSDIKDPAFAIDADSTATKDLRIRVEGANITGNIYGGGNMANITGKTYIKVGPEGQTQTIPANNQQPAPARPAPIRTNQSQSATPQTNAATQSDQTRNATLIRQ